MATHPEGRRTEPGTREEAAPGGASSRTAPPAAAAPPGGLKVGAAFFGWLVAVGVAVLLGALVGAVAGGVGAAAGPPGPANLGAAAITSAVILLVVLAIAYFAGGYVAGRMARFSGLKQGLGVWVVGLVVTVLLAIAGAVLGNQFNVLAQLNLPTIPLDAGTAGVGALISLLVVLVVTLLAAMAGGKVGTRFHRKIDRVTLGG